jgi:hypothetical protein
MDAIVEYKPQPPAPRDVAPPAGGGDVPCVDPADNEELDRKRPDLKLFGNGEDLLTDVCITNPSCATYRRTASTTANHAAGLLERRKIQKYKSIAERERIKFLPAVIEAYGSFGDGITDLIDKITRHRAEHCDAHGVIPAVHFRAWATAAVAASAQRGHSLMVDVAFRHIRRYVRVDRRL